MSELIVQFKSNKFQAGVTMVNGTNFLAGDGRTALSSIDDKKRRLEGFAKRFLTPK